MFNAPSLPQKPVRPAGQAMSSPIPPPPPPQQSMPLDKLEYPLIQPDVVGKYANQVNVEIPPYFHELPKAKLNELYKNEELLKGYVLSKYGEQYSQLKEEVLAALDKQIDFCAKKSAGAEVAEQVARVNRNLQEYHELLGQFDSLQVAMYDKISKTSKRNVVSMLQADLARQEDKTLQLVKEIEAIDGEVSEDKLSAFIESYRKERQSYYLKREKLGRMSEDRVGGLS